MDVNYAQIFDAQGNPGAVLRMLAMSSWDNHYAAADAARSRLEQLQHPRVSAGQYQDTFGRWTTREEVLENLITSVWSDRDLALQAALRRLDELAMADAPAKLTDQRKVDLDRPTQAEAATVELVEIPYRGGDIGVGKPNTIRINGVPVLCPADDPVEIEGMERAGDMEQGLIVRVRMFARRVVIGEPL